MSFIIYAAPAASRALAKLSPQVKKHLLEAIQVLTTNPRQGEQLKSKLRFLRSLHTNFEGTEYRVAYEVDERKKEIYIHYAASRENFYRHLEKLPLKPLGSKHVP